MATMEALTQKAAAAERLAVERLGLDPSEVVVGSLRGIADAGGERVEWRSVRNVEPGFTASCWAESEVGHP